MKTSEDRAQQIALDVNYDLTVFQEFPLWCKVSLPETSGCIEISFKYEEELKDLKVYISRTVHKPRKDACEARYANV